MQPYAIFYAVTSCDADWQYLDTLQASSESDAREEAQEKWKEYSGDLVVVPMVEPVSV